MNTKPVDVSKLEVIKLENNPMEELLAFKREHTMSLCTPSISNTYSICVEYMRNWFVRRFQDGYFKSEFISGKNILADYLNKDVLEYVKRNKPALMITPRLDYEYNRDMTNLYQYGRNVYQNRTRFNDAFFKDPISKNLLSIEMEQLKVDFNFRVKVSTFNHGMDLFKYMQMAYAPPTTKTKYIDLDFQVPKDLMFAIAKDSGFEIKDNDIVDSVGFLRYLNQHSHIPFSYKFRGTKGEYEFYIRMTDMYTHFRYNNLELGDADREGQLENNFIISMDVECLFPAPKFYAYYAKNKHNFSNVDCGTAKFLYRSMCFDAIPSKNDKGWNQYMTTDYVDDSKEFPLDKPTEICFMDLLKTMHSDSFFRIAEDAKSVYISPSAFMDIHLYNAGSERKIKIDWNTYTIFTDSPLPERISEIVFYADLEYINNFTINRSHGYSTRLQDREPLI